MQRFAGRTAARLLGVNSLGVSATARSCSTTGSTAPKNEAAKPVDEGDRWWKPDKMWTGRMIRQDLDPTKKTFDGMYVPELKRVERPGEPELIDAKEETFFNAPETLMIGEVFDQEKKWLPPPKFDPAFDDIEDGEWLDAKVVAECLEAAEQDKMRLAQLGNPMAMDEQVDFFLQPSREGQDNSIQRSEFNGFLHWGLLYAANISMDQLQDTKKAHQYLNKYLRDMDIFKEWLKHPKVVEHIKLKFKVDMTGRFDQLMAQSIALYLRAKAQCMEQDFSGALKSLVAVIGMIKDGGNLENQRHRDVFGAAHMFRGQVFLQLGSPAKCEEDLTRGLTLLPHKKVATVYQIRAEAREQLGKIDLARADEETAADMWEDAELMYPGLDHPPVKWVH